MKDLFKNILKLSFISLLILLSSCEKDIYGDALIHNQKGFKYGVVSLNQIKKQNPTAANTINKLHYDLKTNIQSKTTANLYGFEVDTTKIMYLEKQDGFKSYTLKIAQEIGLNYFKNLVLNEYPDGKFEVRVVKFNLSKTIEQVKLENSLKESIISEEVSKYSIPNNTVNFYSCIEVGYYAPFPSCQGDLVTPEENPGCFNSDGSRAYYEVFIILEQSCGWSSGGDTTDGPASEGPGTDEGGGVGGITDNAVFIPNMLNDTEAQLAGHMPLGMLVDFFENKLKKDDDVNGTNTFLVYNSHREEFINYLIRNNFSDNSKNFVYWAINFLIEKPTVNFEQFKNWFMKPIEGVEASGLLDITYLTANPQPLPTFDDFLLAFPSHIDISAEQVYADIGGAVLTKYNQGARNTCALRISRGLNYAGVTIPNIPGVTVKGADNKNYFLVAKNLLTWMKSTFGTPTGSNHLTGADGGDHGANFQILLGGKKGIYIMIPTVPGGCDTPTTIGNGFCASGHADLFYDNICDGGCYFDARGGVSEIFFWELP